jgi:glycosyltransferase involved in cell wall biosynthesis
MSFFTALRQYAINRLEDIGTVDLLIGIPCYNDDQTVAEVMRVASHGAREYFPDMKALVFVSDGGSTDDSRDKAQAVEIDPYTEKLIQIYRGLPGKGSALRGVFEAASYLKAKATAVIDADLRSITPDWIEKLATPVLGGGYDFVAPLYSRYKYDGTITNNIAYNMTRTLYGHRVRQPIGGDFGVSTRLTEAYLKEDVWDTDVAKFGIDIWMTTVACTAGFYVCQSRLGLKVHGKKDPGVHLGAMFREVVITMFILMEELEGTWKKVKGSKPVKTIGEAPEEEPEPFPVDTETLAENFRLGLNHFGSLWKSILGKEDYSFIRGMKKARPEEFDLPVDVWARVLYDFASTFHMWPKDRAKLVNMMTPLYYAQVASFINQTGSMSNMETEHFIEQNAQRFEELKPYLIDKWNDRGKTKPASEKEEKT